jgi:hypothetical protein
MNMIKQGGIYQADNILVTPKRLRHHRNRLVSNHLTGFGGGTSLSGTSYLFDATDDALQVADSTSWDIFGSSATDRTISAFVRLQNAAVSSQQIVTQSESTADRWGFYHNATSGLAMILRTGNSNQIAISHGSTTISDTAFHHVAMCKVADKYGLYHNGVQVAYIQDSSTDTYAATLGVGGHSIAGALSWDGHLDDIFIAHTNTFSASPNVGLSDTITIPTASHVSDANTKLHIKCDEAIDSGTSGSGATFTESGNDSLTVTELDGAIRATDFFKF